MLVVHRKPRERILLSNGVVITLVDIRSPWKAVLGIEAPPEVSIVREEIATPEQVERAERLARGEGH